MADAKGIRAGRAFVELLAKNGRPVASVMDLPEGWYCLPTPDDADERGAGEDQ